MRRLGGELLTLACLGILASFLSLLFVASVRGRSDGREIPFPAVLGESGCYVSGCHLTPGSTLNQAGSVSFNHVPASFVPGETYDLGITMTGGSVYGFQLAAVFSDDTQAGALTAVTEETMVDDVQGVQILTQTRPLVANSVDFQWTSPMEPIEGSVTLKVASNSANGDSSPLGDAINTLEVSIPLGTDTLTTFIPVVLDLRGKSNSHFTSELALTNRGPDPAMLNFTYTADAGGGSGAATDMMGPHQQMILPNAIDYLRDLEVPIPDTGSRIGTLRVDVSGSSDVSVVVRTTTPTAVPEGRAGLAYLGVPENEGFHDEAVYLCGLRETELDRSNVALQNMGAEGSITLRTTVFSGNPADRSGHMLDDQRLGPGEFHQHNAVLKEKGDPINGGYVKVERVEGTAPFYAYGVINDNANSDGSFVFPVSAGSLEGAMGQTLPVVVETSRFTSELTLTNFSDQQKLVMFSATHERIETEDNTAGFGPLPILPGQQFIIPNAIATARQRFGFNLPSGLAVPLFATEVGGDMSGIVIGARTGSPADPEDISKGQYSVFYTAVPQGAGFTDSAWVDGLQQNEENRSNLALVNTGEVDDSESVFSLEIYDGETSQLVATISNADTTVAAKRWHQINGILRRYAPGTTQGYVRITKMSGSNPFLAYGVVNDGGSPGQRTGDGAYIPARP